ncbi:hypothetical protein GV819_16930 [Pseudomonas sp. Fl5BN2]|uniref:hypothetical protein n=1 Tax=Pseudomonas sp. Fl5BN2 TaxID=2697652 RepID=UPI00137734E4|nr:hypothetical protein [Pseudomonas sp. Fl5BN2]NBF03979.1 hypothetical protein [Pseudomonas sp. Fl5BN2]
MPIANLHQQNVAAQFKSPGVGAMQMAVRVSEAGFEDDVRHMMKIVVSFQEADDKLARYADEVKAQRITRTKADT